MNLNDNWDQEKARNLIGCLVLQAGLSATEIARRAGLAPSTLTRIYPRPSVGYSLSPRSIAKIREAFPQLLSCCEIDQSRVENGSAFSEREEQPTQLAILASQRIPIYATTLLSSDEAEDSNLRDIELWECDDTRPVAHMAAPYLGGEAKRYFAVFIPSEAMEPRFRAGERVILDRIKPASLGMDVLVNLREGSRTSAWTAGRLQMRDRNLINLLQYRNNVSVTVHRSNINQLFPIIGMIDEGI